MRETDTLSLKVRKHRYFCSLQVINTGISCSEVLCTPGTGYVHEMDMPPPAFTFLPYSADPPEYANTPPVQLTLLMVGDTFTLNCTPSAANPPVDTVSIEVDGSPIICVDSVTVTHTITSVRRSHSGNYSCNATNTRGSAVIYHNFLVVGMRCSVFMSMQLVM